MILAAGKGVRMASTWPKPLHAVCGIPMLEHVASALRGAGVDRLVVVVQSDQAQLPEFAAAAGRDVTFATQEEPRGTADALKRAREATGDADQLLLVYADTPLIQTETVRRLRHRHAESAAALTLVTTRGVPADGLGRILRAGDGSVHAIVEEAEADAATQRIDEVNSGWYAFDASWVWRAVEEITPAPNGEYYLTDLVGIAVEEGRTVADVRPAHPSEVLGVNDRAQLALAEREMRSRINRRWMLSGVTLIDPDSTYIDSTVKLSPDVTVHPNTHLRGSTRISSGCTIGPNSVIRDSTFGEGSRCEASHCEAATVGRRVDVGPFSHLRPGTVVEDDVHLGNHVEVKNSRLAAGSRVGHFSYVGDAEIGRRVNIGAGTVTCNFDGVHKHRTVVADDAFIGSGTMIVAPVEIGRGAVSGAGAVITKNVIDGARVAGVPASPLRDQKTSKADREADLSPPGRMLRSE